MNATNNITDTVVALRRANDNVYAVTWDADKSFTVWQIEDVFNTDTELGRWTQVETCNSDAPRSVGEAVQVGDAVLTVFLEKRTVIFTAK